MRNSGYSQLNPKKLHKELLLQKTDTGRVNILIDLSTYYSNSIGDSAIYYSKQALELLKNKKDKKRELWAYRVMSNGYFFNQDYNESLKYIFKSITLAEEIKDTFEMAKSYQFAGSVLFEISSEEKSMSYLRKAQSLLLSKPSDEILANIYNDFAYIFSMKENYDSSLVYQLKVYEIDLRSKTELNEENLATDEHNIGAVYFHLENYGKAEEFINKSYQRRLKLGNTQMQLSSLNVLNAIAIRKNNYQKALELTLQASKIAHQIHSAKELATIYNRFKLIYYNLNKYATSYNYSDSEVIAVRRMQNEEVTRLANETEAKFQNEKQGIENRELLNKNLLSEKVIKQQKLMFVFITGALIVTITLTFFVYRGFKKQKANNFIIESQKKETEQKSMIIEEKQKEILDSIHYANRIQKTLLAHDDFLKNNLPEHFIFFSPKDIVSGDFYWATSTGSDTNKIFYLAVCDSTGHGVPGAFMSLLNINFLNEAINEKGIKEPGKIFNYVRERLITSVSKEGQQDGYDGILLRIDSNSETISYAAAQNSPVLICNNQLNILDTNRMPVGKGEKNEEFKTYTLNAKKSELIYLYTDGFADQFGGQKGKKFKYKQLNELLLSIHQLPMTVQKEKIREAFLNWKGNLEQVDDVLIIGIKI